MSLLFATAHAPSRLRRSALPCLWAVIPALLSAQATRTREHTTQKSTSTGELPRHYVGGPTTPAITAADLMTRLYIFADDSMMGRLAGTEYNTKGTAYIEREVRRIGLQPGGEDGTYFQYPLTQRTIAPSSAFGAQGSHFELWKDFAPRDQGAGGRAFDGAQVIYAGSLGDTAHMISTAAAAGKVALVTLGTDSAGKPQWQQVNRARVSARFADAVAVVVVQLDDVPAGWVDQVYRTPNTTVKGAVSTQPAPAFIYVSHAVARALLGVTPEQAAPGTLGRPAEGHVDVTDERAPGRNVIGILSGSDPALRGQYVAIGAHNDHVGFGSPPVEHDSIRAFNKIVLPQGADNAPPNPSASDWAAIRHMTDSLRALHGGPRPDSIFNGADDDGSGSVSVLEIAESFATAKVRPKRSLLFIWHTGEELGLLGSSYFTDNPTVPRDSIVAELNIDMIGRGGAGDFTGVTKDGAPIHGGPGYVQLIGSRRLSTELGDLAEKVNADRHLGLNFDYALDANGHPQNIYCRSDHYMYARYGIPIVFFTTGGHADYHQVTDEPQYIDYHRMQQVAQLVHDLGVRVANLDHRLVVDHPKPDPHGECRQ